MKNLEKKESRLSKIGKIFLGIFVTLFVLGIIGQLFGVSDEVVENEKVIPQEVPIEEPKVSVDVNQKQIDIAKKSARVTLDFISDNSNTMEKHLTNNDVISAVGYAIGTTSSESLEKVTNSMDESIRLATNEEAISILTETKSVFLEYIDCMKRIADGNIDDKAVQMIKDVTPKIVALSQRISN